MKKVSALLFLALLGGSGFVATKAVGHPLVVAAKKAFFPTPETAEAFWDGRADARAWDANWRANGSNQADFNAEHQMALSNEQSAEYNSVDYYYWYGYRTGLDAYK